ncbi:uncharacterized protein PRD47_003995 isoform 1-T3 [Ara ararauna]
MQDFNMKKLVNWRPAILETGGPYTFLNIWKYQALHEHAINGTKVKNFQPMKHDSSPTKQYFVCCRWNGPNSFCKSGTTMESQKGRSLCNIYLNKKNKHEQEICDHFSVNNKSSSLLLIFSKN